MDPAFGGQELFDSLSQASSASRSRASRAESIGTARSGGGGIGRHFSANKHIPVNDSRRVHVGGGASLGATTISSLGNTSRLEDVYRMVGQSLSLQVHNGEDHRLRNPRARARVGMQKGSCFQRLTPGDRPNHPPLQQGGPSPKVARLQRHHYSQDLDRAGNNGNGRNGASASPGAQQQRILKKLTTQRKESFQKWRLRTMQKSTVTPVGNNTSNSHHAHRYTTNSGMLNNGSSRMHESSRNKHGVAYDAHETSPQRHAFSKMALKQPNNVSGSPQKHTHGRLHDIDEQQQTGQLDEQREPQQPIHTKSSASLGSKGLLGSVIEGGAAAAAAGGSESTLESESVHSLPSMQSSQAISKTSARMVAANLATCQDGAIQFSSPRGPCLTNPSQPVTNEGFDNADGNLILYQNDIIIIPKCKRLVSSKSSSAISPSAGMELRIEAMLGQGTFAQVFCCYDPALRKHVALKIVKNKPAYTKQAMVEIEVFHALLESQEKDKSKEKSVGSVGSAGTTASNTTDHADREPNYMVDLLSYFMYRSHLCLVFELLGLNLYEVLKRRQFLGLSLPMVRSVISQALSGICTLSQQAIVHCDLKPENILLISENVTRTMVASGRSRRRSPPIPEKDENVDSQSLDSRKSKDDTVASSVSKSNSSNTRAAMAAAAVAAGSQKIKLIDFGSACFEGYSSHTYTQSRFYRSPEVLMGLPYDSAIDMWSLGCIAAELYLGLPILPGVHEHDQCGRICEMICNIPDWMLEQGMKSSKYFVKYVPRPSADVVNGVDTKQDRPVLPQWRIKTQQEYINSLSQNEIRKKGGLQKLQKQPGNRYFKRKLLKDIIMLHGQSFVGEEKELLVSFVHFLYGLLEPDPWKRWTGFQAIHHPFISRNFQQLRPRSDGMSIDSKKENHANLELDHFWAPPWDPAICRRQLLNVQKMREKQETSRRNLSDAKRMPDTSTSSRGVGLPSSSSKSVHSDFGTSNLRHLQSQRRRNEALLSSSLSEIGLPGSQAVLASEQPSEAGYSYDITQLPSGAQSLTGVSLDLNRAQVGGDFGYALQRPGVVPADGTDATTIASYTSLNSQSSLGMMGAPPQTVMQLRQQHPVDGNYSMQSSTDQSFIHPRMVTTNRHGGVSHFHRDGQIGMTSTSFTDYGDSEMAASRSIGGYYDESKSRSVGGRFDGGRHRVQLGTEMSQSIGSSYNERLTAASQASESGSLPYLSNSLGRDNSGIGQQSQMVSEYQQSMIYQQQLAALQAQHQQQLAALQAQHQQQLAGQGVAVHPPQMSYQQQQNFVGNAYGGAPGGYYYVTAADGTPVLMQTVGALGAVYPPGGANSLPGQQQQHMMQQGFEQRGLNGQHGSNRDRDYS